MLENLNNISNTIVEELPHLKNFQWLPPPPPPTYTLEISGNQFNETSIQIINVLVITENVPDGTILYLNIDSSSNATADDFETKPDSVTINDNSGSVSWTLKADVTTEGNETLKINLLTDSISGTVVTTSDVITINDTSTGILGIPFNVKPLRLLSKVIYDISDTQSRGKYRNTTIPSDTRVFVHQGEQHRAPGFDWSWKGSGNVSYDTVHGATEYSNLGAEEVAEHINFFTCLMNQCQAGRWYPSPSNWREYENLYSAVNEAFCGRKRQGIEPANHQTFIYNSTSQAGAKAPVKIHSIYRDIEGREWVANTVIHSMRELMGGTLENADADTHWSLSYVDGVNSHLDNPPHEFCHAEVDNEKTVIYNMYEFDNKKVSILMRIDLDEDEWWKQWWNVGSTDILKIIEETINGNVQYRKYHTTYIFNNDSISVREKFGSSDFLELTGNNSTTINVPLQGYTRILSRKPEKDSYMFADASVNTTTTTTEYARYKMPGPTTLSYIYVMDYALYKKVGSQYKLYNSENFDIFDPRTTYQDVSGETHSAHIYPLLNSMERWNRTDIIYCVDFEKVGLWRITNDIFFDNSGTLNTGEKISDLVSYLFNDNFTRDNFELEDWSRKEHEQESIYNIWNTSYAFNSSLSKYLQQSPNSPDDTSTWVPDRLSTVVRWAQRTESNWEPSGLGASYDEVYGTFTDKQYFWAGWRQYSEEDQWVNEADFMGDLNRKNISMCIVDHSGSNPEPNELHNYEFHNTNGFDTNPWGLKDLWQWGNPTAFFARTMIPFPKAMDISANGINIEKTDVISIMDLMDNLENEEEGKSIFIQWPTSFKNVQGKWWDISYNGAEAVMWMRGKDFIDYFSIDDYPFSPLVDWNRNWYFQTSSRQEEKYAWGLIDGRNADGIKVSHVPDISEVENIYLTKPAQVFISNQAGKGVQVDVSWNTFYRSSNNYNSSIILSSPPAEGDYGQLIVPILKKDGHIFEYQGEESIDLSFNEQSTRFVEKVMSESFQQNFEDDLASWYHHSTGRVPSRYNWPSNNSIRWYPTYDGINHFSSAISYPLDISDTLFKQNGAKSVAYAILLNPNTPTVIPAFSLPDKIPAKNGTDEFIIRYNNILHIPQLTSNQPIEADFAAVPLVEYPSEFGTRYPIIVPFFAEARMNANIAQPIRQVQTKTMHPIHLVTFPSDYDCQYCSSAISLT